MEINEIMEKKIYEREQFGEIMKWIDDREMLMFIGSRQTGKTSIMYGIAQRLVKSGKAKEEDIYFFDAENIREAEMLGKGPDEITAHIKPGENGKKYLFIDEMHYINNIDRTLKYLVDHYGDNLKIFVTGSSSLEINRRIRESMAGRKIVFEIYPLGFGEALLFSGKKHLHGVYAGAASLKTAQGISSENRRLLRLEFENYCIYGGYPRVVLETDNGKKEKLLDGIYSSYVRKDIASFLGGEGIDGFNNLVRYIAINSGGEFNYQSVSRELGIARKKLEQYIALLENTYIAARIKPFSNNKKSEIVKMPKIYFYDNGMRNRVLNSFAPASGRVDAGTLIETAAFRALLRIAAKTEQVKYWRTKTGNEIDFVIDGEKLLVFECKRSASSFSLAKYADFIAKYKPEAFYVLNTDREEKGEVVYKELFLL